MAWNLSQSTLKKLKSLYIYEDISSSLIASRPTGTDPLDDLPWGENAQAKISPAAERDGDSGLCRSSVRGKGLKGLLMQLVPLGGV